MEKKKGAIRLTESQLVGFIAEGVKQTLKEFRGDDYLNSPDGDRRYTSPSGKLHFPAYNDDYSKIGKRALGNSYNSLMGKMSKTYGPGEYSHGKGELCYEVIKFMEEKFQLDNRNKPNGKIEWTEKELELINKIELTLYKLAMLSKEEGNKKRGYDGPKGKDSQKEDGQLSELKKGSKKMMTESQLVSHIYEKVKKSLGE